MYQYVFIYVYIVLFVYVFTFVLAIKSEAGNAGVSNRVKTIAPFYHLYHYLCLYLYLFLYLHICICILINKEKEARKTNDGVGNRVTVIARPLSDHCFSQRMKILH